MSNIKNGKGSIRFKLLILIVIIAAAGSYTRDKIFDEGSYVSSEATEQRYSFRSEETLSSHFEKHGEEFPYETAEEYLAGANDVINDPDALYKTEEEDGDGVYYLEDTNELVILSTDGYIRTYFKPDDGKAYFDRT